MRFSTHAPIEWQLSLFDDIPPTPLTARRKDRLGERCDRPMPTLVYRGPKRDTRLAYDRPEDVQS